MAQPISVSNPNAVAVGLLCQEALPEEKVAQFLSQYKAALEPHIAEALQNTLKKRTFSEIKQPWGLSFQNVFLKSLQALLGAYLTHRISWRWMGFFPSSTLKLPLLGLLLQTLKQIVQGRSFVNSTVTAGGEAHCARQIQTLLHDKGLLQLEIELGQEAHSLLLEGSVAPLLNLLKAKVVEAESLPVQIRVFEEKRGGWGLFIGKEALFLLLNGALGVKCLVFEGCTPPLWIWEVVSRKLFNVPKPTLFEEVCTEMVRFDPYLTLELGALSLGLLFLIFRSARIFALDQIKQSGGLALLILILLSDQMQQSSSYWASSGWIALMGISLYLWTILRKI